MKRGELSSREELQLQTYCVVRSSVRYISCKDDKTEGKENIGYLKKKSS